MGAITPCRRHSRGDVFVKAAEALCELPTPVSDSDDNFVKPSAEHPYKISNQTAVGQNKSNPGHQGNGNHRSKHLTFKN